MGTFVTQASARKYINYGILDPRLRYGGQALSVPHEVLMPKYKDRQLELIDLIDRFESSPSGKHTRDALGLIGRLRDDGLVFWDESSPQPTHWREYSDDLWVFLNNLGQRRDSEKQDLQTALREFIQLFEHFERRMDQLLHQFAGRPAFDRKRARIREWTNLVFRISTYAIASFWIDDKQEEITGRITINIMTGERREEWNRIEMQIPKKYRAATEKFWLKRKSRPKRTP